MTQICGIYGYSITRVIELAGFQILPRTADHKQANTLARNLDTYQLTAVLVGENISEEFILDLEAILLI